MDSLTGKVAIITGAASGIGRATASALAKRGARIVVADINGEGAATAAAAIDAAGGQAAGVRCDVSADNPFDDLKSFALDRFGAVDVVTNNVGGLTRGRPEYLPIHQWRRVLDLNLMSVVRSNATFLPLLIEQRHGHIVNTASFAGLFSYSYDRLPYAAAKAAVVQMSEGLRLYLRPMGIGVTVLCPGPAVHAPAGSRHPRRAGLRLELVHRPSVRPGRRAGLRRDEYAVLVGHSVHPGDGGCRGRRDARRGRLRRDRVLRSPDLSARAHVAVSVADGPTGVVSRHRVAGFVGADRCDGGGDGPAAVLQRGIRRTGPPVVGGGQAGGHGIGGIAGAGLAGGRCRVDARGI